MIALFPSLPWPVIFHRTYGWISKAESNSGGGGGEIIKIHNIYAPVSNYYHSPVTSDRTLAASSAYWWPMEPCSMPTTSWSDGLSFKLWKVRDYELERGNWSQICRVATKWSQNKSICFSYFFFDFAAFVNL